MVSALIRAGQELVTHQPLDQLFETILQLSLSAVEAKRGVILTLDEGELQVRASKGDGFTISAAVRDQVLRDKCSLSISDAMRARCAQQTGKHCLAKRSQHDGRSAANRRRA